MYIISVIFSLPSSTDADEAGSDANEYVLCLN